jgi:phage terminase large subunit-like protein
MRLGRHPQIVATTTPLPLSVIKDLLQDPDCVTRRGTTDSNRANLPASTLRTLHNKFDGTAKGRQELDGDLLEEVDGALWKQKQIDDDRITDGLPLTYVDKDGMAQPFALVRVVLAVDPAVEDRKSDELLEDQLVTWTTDETESPDRLDAYVYAVLHLRKAGIPKPPRRSQGVIPRHQMNTRHAMLGRR